MSENGQAPPGEAVAEPSLAELFDPAALEARLAEARTRRAAAIAKRAAAGPASAAEVRTGRIRTLDMGTAERLPGKDPFAAPPAPAPAPVRSPLTVVPPAPAPVRATPLPGQTREVGRTPVAWP
ncbi:MAG TPA: hypothetical protein VM422_01610, partial [Amaricoccus sp.]|nr:hypothetical protein [Amaricoccus sp.]